MMDPYSVLGITSGADDDTIKKAYRQKCKQYHPDLHPDDPACEDKFKEVQAAYSEIMRRKNGGGSPNSGYGGGYNQSQSGGSYGSYGQQNSYSGFRYGPFGFGFYSTYGGSQQSYGQQNWGGSASPELQAATNYIRSGYYEEALNALNGLSTDQRTAQWHYYAALANSGLGRNIQARDEARIAVDMEPQNYQYQNLLNRLQNAGSSYSDQQQQYPQPGGYGSGILQLLFYWLMCMCCCSGRGGFFFC